VKPEYLAGILSRNSDQIPKILTADWLSMCLKQQQIVEDKNYLLDVFIPKNMKPIEE
jgi:hypothetical protein